MVKSVVTAWGVYSAPHTVAEQGEERTVGERGQGKGRRGERRGVKEVGKGKNISC